MLFIHKLFFCITSYLPFVSVCLNTVCSQTQNSDEGGDLKTSCPSCFSYHWFICLFICAEMIPTFGVQIYLQLFCVLYCQLYVIFSSSKVCWVLQKCYLELLLEAHSTDKLGPNYISSRPSGFELISFPLPVATVCFSFTYPLSLLTSLCLFAEWMNTYEIKSHHCLTEHCTGVNIVLACSSTCLVSVTVNQGW